MAIGSVGNASMGDVMRIGAEGIARGTQRFAKASAKVVEDLDPAAMIESKLAQAQTKAGVAVVKQADEMLGHLIDELG